MARALVDVVESLAARYQRAKQQGNQQEIKKYYELLEKKIPILKYLENLITNYR